MSGCLTLDPALGTVWPRVKCVLACTSLTQVSVGPRFCSLLLWADGRMGRDLVAILETSQSRSRVAEGCILGPGVLRMRWEHAWSPAENQMLWRMGTERSGASDEDTELTSSGTAARLPPGLKEADWGQAPTSQAIPSH